MKDDRDYDQSTCWKDLWNLHEILFFFNFKNVVVNLILLAFILFLFEFLSRPVYKFCLNWQNKQKKAKCKTKKRKKEEEEGQYIHTQCRRRNYGITEPVCYVRVTSSSSSFFSCFCTIITFSRFLFCMLGKFNVSLNHIFFNSRKNVNMLLLLLWITRIRKRTKQL